MATEIIKQIVITVCNCFQFLFDQMFDIQSEVYNQRAQVTSTISRGLRNSKFKERETNHFKMTQKTMHSCLKKCLQLVVLSYCWTRDRAIASEVVARSGVTPRQGCNTRKPLIRAQSKTVLTAHGSPTNGRLVVGKYLEDCKLITSHIPFKFLLDLLYTNKDSSLLSQTHRTNTVTSRCSV